MLRSMGALALIACASAAATGAEPAALPGWMAGCWIEEKGAGWTEECWTSARGGVMLGSGRNGEGTALRSWEAMQIVAADGTIAFWAAPGGIGRTRFALASANAREIVFANPANDYPQRIRYWREGEALNAEISLADGSKPMRWTYRRQR